MKHNKRLKNHLNKAYEHNEKARNIIQKEIEKQEQPNSLLVDYKLQTLDVKLKLKTLISKADELL